MGAIFLTIVLDLLGFGLVLPFLPEEARDAFGAPAFVATSLSAVYSLMQFVFAPLWGRFSDRVGRKPVLVWSVAATAVSNLGLGIALAWGNSVGWLFLARIAAGIATANLAVASAYIADITSKEERSRGMGLIGMAFGLGFILGPGIGGVLSEHTIGGRHGPLACFVAAGLSAINVVWVVAGVRESLSKGARAERSRTDFGAAFRDPMIVRVVLVNFVVILWFASLEQTLRLFNKDVFAMSVRETGLLLAFVGIVAAGIQGGFVRVVGPKIDESVLVRAGAIIQVVAFVLVALSPSVGKWMLYVGGATLAIGNGLSQPGIAAYVSNRAGKSEQGKMLGVSQSASSLGRVLGPAIGGLLYGSLGPASPYIAGAIGMALASIISLTLAPSRGSRVEVLKG
jgi:MFS family permease